MSSSRSFRRAAATAAAITASPGVDTVRARRRPERRSGVMTPDMAQTRREVTRCGDVTDSTSSD